MYNIQYCYFALLNQPRNRLIKKFKINMEIVHLPSWLLRFHPLKYNYFTFSSFSVTVNCSIFCNSKLHRRLKIASVRCAFTPVFLHFRLFSLLSVEDKFLGAGIRLSPTHDSNDIGSKRWK